LYLPKDIVSGDFYWVRQINPDELFLAVADCTGHGVPGAMVSALSIQKLNELSEQTNSPSTLLSLLNNSLKKTLNQDQEGFSKDGLDICLCKINKSERKLTYSGANRSLQVFQELGLKREIKATKTGIGGHTPDNQIYAEHELVLEKNELIIMSTDGFADQFGGNENKKITTKRFKDWITEIFSEELKKEALENKYKLWKGQHEQIDDVCVLGFKI
jgi:serine phosphatase RsbU (regulator of sigma subunit)